MSKIKQKILVTGATGFVGSELVDQLIKSGHEVRILVRNFSTRLPVDVKQVIIGSLENAFVYSSSNHVLEQRRYEGSELVTSIAEAFDGIEVVIHSAARTHVMNEKPEEPVAEFRKVNFHATINLAHQAAKAGVKRFIFLSTIKVNGESTTARMPFTEDDDCNPTDPYAISKWEAEQGLMKLAKQSGMEVVIIRPPLIYGPGVKGNFASMMKWVSKGFPLPFARVKNQRSLLALDNLVSFILTCLDHPNAANETFLLSDGEDLSMPELIQKIAHFQGTKVRLIPVPVSWMKFVAMILGKKDITDRLFGSLQVNCNKAHELLSWSPAVSVDEQLKKMVESS